MVGCFSTWARTELLSMAANDSGTTLMGHLVYTASRKKEISLHEGLERLKSKKVTKQKLMHMDQDFKEWMKRLKWSQPSANFNIDICNKETLAPEEVSLSNEVIFIFWEIR